MRRIIGGVVMGAVLGLVIALAINEFIFAGPEYGDALAWAAIGGALGGTWAWRERATRSKQ